MKHKGPGQGPQKKGPWRKKKRSGTSKFVSGGKPKQRIYRSDRHVERELSDPDRPAIDESQAGIRINKYMATLDLGSRRQIDRWIEEGRIKVNGVKAEPGQRIRQHDHIQLDGKNISHRKPKRQYLLLNKPRGIVCTMDSNVRGNLTDYLNLDFRIYPVGRLDKESTGLLLLTNDGTIVNPILRGQYAHKKVYEVEVDQPITDDFCRQMAEGVRILGQVTLPTELVPTGKQSFRLTLTQGLNRQIRRMCEALGYEVVNLRRIQIMHLGIRGLPEGEWRSLTHGELQQLDEILEQSTQKLQGELEADWDSEE